MLHCCAQYCGIAKLQNLLIIVVWVVVVFCGLAEMLSEMGLLETAVQRYVIIPS